MRDPLKSDASLCQTWRSQYGWNPDGGGPICPEGGAYPTTRIHYDTLGRRVRIDDPDAGTWTWSYDDAGLLVPETVVCERVEDAMAAVRAMGDVVIKPIFGSLGHGMVRVSDPETALRVVRALDQIKSVFYVQRAIDHSGHDLRILVVGGRVIGAIERRAPVGEWRTNVAIGGSATAVAVTHEIERIALTAAAAVGADYAGVDVLPARDGQAYILEVNGIPGWQGLQQATGIDVAGAIVQHVEQCVEREAAARRSEESLRA